MLKLINSKLNLAWRIEVAGEWSKYCRVKDFTLMDNNIEVKLGNQRAHKISVEDDGDALLLVARVAKSSIIKHVPEIRQSILKRNRLMQLMGFRINKLGHLIGYCWLPKEGLSNVEFQFYVRKLAFESDRYEYMLTGKDIE
jgi:hypothetical protein